VSAALGTAQPQPEGGCVAVGSGPKAGSGPPPPSLPLLPDAAPLSRSGACRVLLDGRTKTGDASPPHASYFLSPHPLFHVIGVWQTVAVTKVIAVATTMALRFRRWQSLQPGAYLSISSLPGC
jgi:hypothetical protein